MQELQETEADLGVGDLPVQFEEAGRDPLHLDSVGHVPQKRDVERGGTPPRIILWFDRDHLEVDTMPGKIFRKTRRPMPSPA